MSIRTPTLNSLPTHDIEEKFSFHLNFCSQNNFKDCWNSNLRRPCIVAKSSNLPKVPSLSSILRRVSSLSSNLRLMKFINTTTVPSHVWKLNPFLSFQLVSFFFFLRKDVELERACRALSLSSFEPVKLWAYQARSLSSFEPSKLQAIKLLAYRALSLPSFKQSSF